jgi:RND family efflux transporter MFP subunit
MIKRIITIVISLSILGGLSFLIVKNIKSGIEKKKQEVERQRKLTNVDQRFLIETATVKSGTISRTLDLSGTVTPKTKATVFSMVPGVIQKIEVEEGDLVKKGDKLARLEGWKMVLAYKQAKSVLSQANLGLLQMKTDYNRLKSLYEKDAIPKADFEKVDIGYKMAKARVDQAKSMVSMASATWSDTTIKAPISGTVIMKMVEQGDLLTSSQAMKMSPLLIIAELDSVKIEVYVIEKNISLISTGLKARVTVDAYDTTFIGTVTKIGEMMDPLTRTLKITIKVNNKERIISTPKGDKKFIHPLKIGMFARVFLVLERKSNRIIIPADSILTELKRSFVFVYKDGKTHKREVKKGILDGEDLEIAAGLKEGEKLVVIGHRSVHDGQEVRLMKSSPFIHHKKKEVKNPTSGVKQ